MSGQSELLWFTTSSGRIEICMTLEQARSAAHQGRCDDDVEALSRVPEIAKQLDSLLPSLLARELREYGAWDDSELSDHEMNKRRILWIAANDITEEAC